MVMSQGFVHFDLQLHLVPLILACFEQCVLLYCYLKLFAYLLVGKAGSKLYGGTHVDLYINAGAPVPACPDRCAPQAPCVVLDVSSLGRLSNCYRWHIRLV